MKRTNVKLLCHDKSCHGEFYKKGTEFVSVIDEALPGILWNRGTRAFISGEQGNKVIKMKEIGEQRQFWRTGNIGIRDWIGEQ